MGSRRSRAIRVREDHVARSEALFLKVRALLDHYKDADMTLFHRAIRSLRELLPEDVSYSSQTLLAFRPSPVAVVDALPPPKTISAQALWSPPGLNPSAPVFFPTLLLRPTPWMNEEDLAHSALSKLSANEEWAGELQGTERDESTLDGRSAPLVPSPDQTCPPKEVKKEPPAGLPFVPTEVPALADVRDFKIRDVPPHASAGKESDAGSATQGQGMERKMTETKTQDPASLSSSLDEEQACLARLSAQVQEEPPASPREEKDEKEEEVVEKDNLGLCQEDETLCRAVFDELAEAAGTGDRKVPTISVGSVVQGMMDLGLELTVEEEKQLRKNAEEQQITDVDFAEFVDIVMDKACCSAEQPVEAAQPTELPRGRRASEQLPRVLQEDAESVRYEASNGSLYQVFFTAREPYQLNMRTGSVREVARFCPEVPAHQDPFAPGAVWRFEASFHKDEVKPGTFQWSMNSQMVEYPAIVSQLVEARFQAALRAKVPESLPPERAKGMAFLLIINGVVFSVDEEARREIESCSG